MTLWLAAKPLVLASQSKVRRALIEAAGGQALAVDGDTQSLT